LIPNHFGDSVGGPEKAGVGGSIPSLATNNSSIKLETAGKACKIFSREQYANIDLHISLWPRWIKNHR
jgi:hypothetical protein